MVIKSSEEGPYKRPQKWTKRHHAAKNFVAVKNLPYVIMILPHIYVIPILPHKCDHDNAIM